MRRVGPVLRDVAESHLAGCTVRGERAFDELVIDPLRPMPVDGTTWLGGDG